jgi:hypothetical protein
MYNCQCGSFALCRFCVKHANKITDASVTFCDKCETLYCGNSEAGCVDPCQVDDEEEDDDEEEEDDSE